MGSAFSATARRNNLIQAAALQILSDWNFFAIIQFASISKEEEDTMRYLCTIFPIEISDMQALYDIKGASRLFVTYKEKKFEIRFLASHDETKHGTLICNKMDPTKAAYLFNLAENPMATAVKHFMELLNLPTLHSLKFIDPNRSIIELCNYPPILTAERMHIRKPTVSAEELDFITTNFSNLWHMNFETIAPAEYKAWPLRYKYAQVDLNFPNRSILTAENLVSMKGDWLETAGSITTTEINRFLKIWLVTKIKMEFVSLTAVEDKGDLFDGLETYPWDKKARGKYYPHKFDPNHTFDCRHCVDIYRDDGTMASIGFRGKFTFLVWKERFPKVPKKQSVFL